MSDLVYLDDGSVCIAENIGGYCVCRHRFKTFAEYVSYVNDLELVLCDHFSFIETVFEKRTSIPEIFIKAFNEEEKRIQ